MPLELHRWYIVTVGIASIVISTVCYLAVRDAINAASLPVKLSLLLLLVSSIGGLFQLLNRLSAALARAALASARSLMAR